MKAEQKTLTCDSGGRRDTVPKRKRGSAFLVGITASSPCLAKCKTAQPGADLLQNSRVHDSVILPDGTGDDDSRDLDATRVHVAPSVGAKVHAFSAATHASQAGRFQACDGPDAFVNSADQRRSEEELYSSASAERCGPPKLASATQTTRTEMESGLLENRSLSGNRQTGDWSAKKIHNLVRERGTEARQTAAELQEGTTETCGPLEALGNAPDSGSSDCSLLMAMVPAAIDDCKELSPSTSELSGISREEVHHGASPFQHRRAPRQRACTAPKSLAIDAPDAKARGSRLLKECSGDDYGRVMSGICEVMTPEQRRSASWAMPAAGHGAQARAAVKQSAQDDPLVFGSEAMKQNCDSRQRSIWYKMLEADTREAEYCSALRQALAWEGRSEEGEDGMMNCEGPTWRDLCSEDDEDVMTFITRGGEGREDRLENCEGPTWWNMRPPSKSVRKMTKTVRRRVKAQQGPARTVGKAVEEKAAGERKKLGGGRKGEGGEVGRRSYRMASRPGRSKANPAAAKTMPTPCGIQVLTQDEIAAIGRGAAVTEEQKQRVFGLSHGVRHPGRTYGEDAKGGGQKWNPDYFMGLGWKPEKEGKKGKEQQIAFLSLREILKNERKRIGQEFKAVLARSPIKLKHGATYYLLHYGWVEKFRNFVDIPEISVPGPIDNLPLMTASGDKLAVDPGDLTPLDQPKFLWLEEPDWRALYGRYSGGPAIKVSPQLTDDKDGLRDVTVNRPPPKSVRASTHTSYVLCVCDPEICEITMEKEKARRKEEGLNYTDAMITITRHSAAASAIRQPASNGIASSAALAPGGGSPRGRPRKGEIQATVSSTSTVKAVKLQIYEKLHVSPAEQKLMYETTELVEGDKTLGEYGVPRDAVVRLDILSPDGDIDATRAGLKKADSDVAAAYGDGSSCEAGEEPGSAADKSQREQPGKTPDGESIKDASPKVDECQDPASPGVGHIGKGMRRAADSSHASAQLAWRQPAASRGERKPEAGRGEKGASFDTGAWVGDFASIIRWVEVWRSGPADGRDARGDSHGGDIDETSARIKGKGQREADAGFSGTLLSGLGLENSSNDNEPITVRDASDALEPGVHSSAGDRPVDEEAIILDGDESGTNVDGPTDEGARKLGGGYERGYRGIRALWNDMSQGLLAHPRASNVRRDSVARGKEMVKNLESILARVWHSGSGDALSTLDEHYSALNVFADLLQNQDGASQYTDVLADVWHQIARISVTRSVLGESDEREWIDCFKKEAQVRWALITELERPDSIHLIGGADHQEEACRQVRLLLRSYSELALAYHNHHEYGKAEEEYGKCEKDFFMDEKRRRQLTRIQNTTERAKLRSLNEKARGKEPPTGNFCWFRGDDVAGADQVSRSAASINADPGDEVIMPDAPAQVPKRNRKGKKSQKRKPQNGAKDGSDSQRTILGEKPTAAKRRRRRPESDNRTETYQESSQSSGSRRGGGRRPESGKGSSNGSKGQELIDLDKEEEFDQGISLSFVDRPPADSLEASGGAGGGANRSAAADEVARSVAPVCSRRVETPEVCVSEAQPDVYGEGEEKVWAFASAGARCKFMKGVAKQMAEEAAAKTKNVKALPPPDLPAPGSWVP